MPDNVLNEGLASWIRQHQPQCLDPTTVDEVNATLSDLVAGTNSRTAAREHLTHLRARKRETSAALSRLPGDSK